MVVILHLGVGQGGALDRAPHHRLGAAIDLARGDELHELGDDRRFGAVVHGRVPVVPVAEHAQALELGRLRLDPAGGVVAAAGAEFGLADLVLGPTLGAERLLDLPFDRQAVTVPAGHVVDVVAEHEARADDEVFQQLVEGVADVDGAIGVGRAIVQHEQRRAGGLAGAADPAIEAIPAFQDARLELRQASAHGEGRLGQGDGFAIVALGGVVGHEGSSRFEEGSGERIPARGEGRHAGRLIRVSLRTRVMRGV